MNIKTTKITTSRYWSVYSFTQSSVLMGKIIPINSSTIGLVILLIILNFSYLGVRGIIICHICTNCNYELKIPGQTYSKRNAAQDI